MSVTNEECGDPSDPNNQINHTVVEIMMMPDHL